MYALLMYVQSDVVVDVTEDDVTSYDHKLELGLSSISCNVHKFRFNYYTAHN